MKKLVLLHCTIFCCMLCMAKTILVKTAAELKQANAAALPGDIIILQDGVWKDNKLEFTCNGTAAQPITFKAQTPGKVFISGHSSLSIGGNYLVVDGFYFTNGYAGDGPIIQFKKDNKTLANNCRVTSTVINDFNNPLRLDENYWVAFYGKNNRMDHCSFFNKKNMGVMMAVILDDERSRENFHSIDHNYFGFRLPLASNTGEMLRVGVSQHCEFNSNTQIHDNFFEHCDGETEIISLKSGANTVRNNLFKECQGAVVLRHGDNNTVENNIFLGNGKKGTGGVRVINKGQWIVNNLFYQCKGTDFRSPLAVMNGVPNSPANRYVAVADAVIANNSFIDCSPVSFGEGSDEERSEAPHNVWVLNNIFYNDHGSVVYNSYDDMSRIYFGGNAISNNYRQNPEGFYKTSFTKTIVQPAFIPHSVDTRSFAIPDSLVTVAKARLLRPLQPTTGFSNKKIFDAVMLNAQQDCGAAWYGKKSATTGNRFLKVFCNSAESIKRAIDNNPGVPLTIQLTAGSYTFNAPLNISTDVSFTSSLARPVQFYIEPGVSDYFLQVRAGNSLSFNNVKIDLDKVSTAVFITTDTSGSSNHSSIQLRKSSFDGFNGTFLDAAKTSVADSIIITGCRFTKNSGTLFNFSNETDKKGYYNVEKMVISNNIFEKQDGMLLNMLRSGNDESTMGPNILFENNVINKCNTAADVPLIYLYGTQHSKLVNNTFTKSNAGKLLIKYEDIVRADHLFKSNTLVASGEIAEDRFVTKTDNTVK